MQLFELFGKPCAIVLRVQMSRECCLDILLEAKNINVLKNTHSNIADLHIPLDRTTLEKVDKGILDAEFIGY